MDYYDAEFRKLIAWVERTYEPSRERSLIVTKLDEAALWATKAPRVPTRPVRDDPQA